MHLERLSLVNFKNYSEAQLQFHPKMNCLVGNNGMGKTNLLDAIHYLSYCKSYFNSIDSQNIKHDQGFFMLQGVFNLHGTEEEIFCGLKKGQKKQFKRNKKEYDKLSDHIGLFPLVIISPNDSELILGGSELRRKFMDSIISQFDKVYLEKLIAYNHILTQRNALLKLFSDTSSFNATGLEVWDDQLIIYGESIKKSRESFIQEFIPLFLKQYQFLSDSSEIVSLDYESSLHTKDFRTLLNSSRERDRILQYTTCGIHRDDLIFKLEDHPIKKFASQGQQKTFLIALKLAQFEIIRERKKISPILLLDDIYDKLDEKRFRKLIHLVGTEEYGQVFVTDSHPQRTEHFFNEIHTAFRIFHVNNTEISVQEHA